MTSSDLFNVFEKEEEPGDTSKQGITFILSSNTFSSPTSQLYLKEQVKTYVDTIQDPIVLQQLQPFDFNLYYSINTTYLWRLLKYKIKDLKTTSKLNKMSFFNIDLTVMQYSLKAAEVMTLHDAYEKVVDSEKAELRQNLKDHVWRIRNNFLKKKQVLENKLKNSTLFQSFPDSKMNLSQEQMLQLKNDLLDAKITPLFKKYLEVVLNAVKEEVRRVNINSDMNTEESLPHKRNIFSIWLLYIYLKIYLASNDWLNTLILLKAREFYFNNITETKGFAIIQRFLSDAPLEVLIKQIKGLS